MSIGPAPVLIKDELLHHSFGRAKAFCCLSMIRRAENQIYGTNRTVEPDEFMIAAMSIRTSGRHRGLLRPPPISTL